MIGTEGTGLLREKRVEGDTTVARSAEGGPPAESECLEWKSLHIPSFRNPLPFRRLKNHPRTPNPILFCQTETRSPSLCFFVLEGHCRHLFIKNSEYYCFIKRTVIKYSLLLMKLILHIVI
ncbi:hypothetical protein E4J71_13005 [Peribacillus frigoritolerans]|nr:hypothetical protein E4J71_13005 [Peribacillus frigoritolerans]